MPPCEWELDVIPRCSQGGAGRMHNPVAKMGGRRLAGKQGKRSRGHHEKSALDAGSSHGTVWGSQAGLLSTNAQDLPDEPLDGVSA